MKKQRTARQVVAALMGALDITSTWREHALEEDIKEIIWTYEKCKWNMTFSEAAMQARIDYLISVEMVYEVPDASPSSTEPSQP